MQAEQHFETSGPFSGFADGSDLNQLAKNFKPKRGAHVDGKSGNQPAWNGKSKLLDVWLGGF
jgi:hypothetical protein